MGDTFRIDRRTLFGVSAAVVTTSHRAVASHVNDSTPEATPPGETQVKMTITFGDTTLTATMTDSQASRDFVELLPLTLTLNDYNNTEKISDLPTPLSTDDAPESFDPSPGDITYYAPWGNLAIFYRDFGNSRGLVHLGTIDEGWEALDQNEPFEVTFAVLEPGDEAMTAIRIRLEDADVMAHLYDNPTARDLTAQLPLTLDFRDYGGQEKLTELPRPLSLEGAPAGSSAEPGDITYYAPNQVIVFVYEPIGHFAGIVPIGRFVDSMDAITSQMSDFAASIEVVE